MYFIINLNKNYLWCCIYFVFKSSKMSSALKMVFVVFHLFLIGTFLLLIFQGSDVVQEKLFLSLLIFVTLNLVRLLQKGDGENLHDQF
jgi:hypothetical protein